VLNLSAPRVPVEFVGLARVFRSQVKLVDVAMNEALIAITAPLSARLSRHPKLRREMIAGAERSSGRRPVTRSWQRLFARRGGRMRKLLLASVATLGTGGLMGAANAQQIGAPTQGQQAWPAANPTAYVNNNNNHQARALPPGTRWPPWWPACPSC
jgi:hypothetical protein